MNTPTPSQINPDNAGIIADAENYQPPSGSWLSADLEKLERFAAELDEIVERLERIRSKQSDMALFLSPSVDPATVRATALLAEDGHDRPGTPVHAISATIDDLRQQVLAARLAARDYRGTESSVVERMRSSAEDPA